MDLNLDFLVEQFQIFFLVLLRISGIFIMSPFFGSFVIPPLVKGAFAFIIAVAVSPIIMGTYQHVLPNSLFEYGLLGIQEMMVGLSIGFICSLIFVLFQVSGQFYSIQMGFGILNVLDPLHQTQMPIIGQFLGLLALLIFLIVGGHHMMLEAVCESYKHLPTFTMNSAGPLASGVAKTFAYMFTTAFKVGMPIIGIMILCDIAMGLLAKAAPQLNVMMFGWPIKTIVGVIALFILMPMLFTISADIFRECFVRIKEILIAMGHAR